MHQDQKRWTCIFTKISWMCQNPIWRRESSCRAPTALSTHSQNIGAIPESGGAGISTSSHPSINYTEMYHLELIDSDTHLINNGLNDMAWANIYSKLFLNGESYSGIKSGWKYSVNGPNNEVFIIIFQRHGRALQIGGRTLGIKLELPKFLPTFLVWFLRRNT